MELSLILVLLLSLLVGVTLGLLGGGGSILTVPILAYVAGLGAREAIAASLFVVGVTSLVGVITHARAGNVRWRTGLVFGVAGMGGGFLGGLAGGHLPGTMLMIAFAVMMLVTAVAMIRGRRRAPAPAATATAAGQAGATQAGAAQVSGAGEAGGASAAEEVRDLPLLRIILDGFLVGGVTGLVGAGGGFLVVPVLALLGGLPMTVAVGTSLLVIAMKSFAAFSGYLTSVDLDWPLVLSVTAAAVAGSFLGVPLARRIPEQALRTAFGWFVLLMGVIVLVQELPATGSRLVLALAGALAVAALACLLLGARCPLLMRGRSAPGMLRRTPRSESAQTASPESPPEAPAPPSAPTAPSTPTAPGASGRPAAPSAPTPQPPHGTETP